MLASNSIVSLVKREGACCGQYSGEPDSVSLTRMFRLAEFKFEQESEAMHMIVRMKPFLVYARRASSAHERPKYQFCSTCAQLNVYV